MPKYTIPVMITLLPLSIHGAGQVRYLKPGLQQNGHDMIIRYTPPRSCGVVISKKFISFLIYPNKDATSDSVLTAA